MQTSSRGQLGWPNRREREELACSFDSDKRKNEKMENGSIIHDRYDDIKYMMALIRFSE